jgi:hypothetical protein
MPHGLSYGEIVALACFARSPADPDNTMAQRHLLRRGFASWFDSGKTTITGSGRMWLNRNNQRA